MVTQKLVRMCKSKRGILIYLRYLSLFINSKLVEKRPVFTFICATGSELSIWYKNHAKNWTICPAISYHTLVSCLFLSLFIYHALVLCFLCILSLSFFSEFLFFFHQSYSQIMRALLISKNAYKVRKYITFLLFSPFLTSVFVLILEWWGGEDHLGNIFLL